MKLDSAFRTDVLKAANGDGGREYRFSLVRELREISAALGNRYDFDSCVQKYGRAKVALCVAATIFQDRFRFEQPQIEWALAVLDLWTNRAGERSLSAAAINIHPAILADNSSSLRRMTSENN